MARRRKCAAMGPYAARRAWECPGVTRPVGAVLAVASVGESSQPDCSESGAAATRRKQILLGQHRCLELIRDPRLLSDKALIEALTVGHDKYPNVRLPGRLPRHDMATDLGPVEGMRLLIPSPMNGQASRQCGHVDVKSQCANDCVQMRTEHCSN